MVARNVRLIQGPPGCGKTTHVVRKALEAARIYGPERVLISSLTKAAAEEVRARRLPIPERQIGTLHSFAFQALGLHGCPNLHVRLIGELAPSAKSGK